MEKRSAARELAFLAIFQLPKDPSKYESKDIKDLYLAAVRTLADHSRSNIKKAEAILSSAEKYILQYQADHSENSMLVDDLKHVAIPTTEDFIDHLDKCYKAVSLLQESMDIPEFTWHSYDPEIEKFTINLILLCLNNKDKIDEAISSVSKSWDFSRILKIDKWIIRLALAEIMMTDADQAVVSAEAMKLAKKYSTEEGIKFINGVLADAVKAAK